ncbi:ATP-binding protein [Nonomuraea sp. NPDC004297]
MAFPGETWVVPVTRHSVATILSGAGYGDVYAARLIVSELVSNAIQHTDSGCCGGMVMVDVVGVGADRARIEVTDEGGETLPCPRSSGPTDSRGRGLRLVAQLAVAWGMRQMRARHLTVWAEFSTAVDAGVCAAFGDGLAREIGA